MTPDDSWLTYQGLRLAVNVVLRHPETGAMVPFGVGDDPPEWARKRMGPHVYGFATPGSPRRWQPSDGRPAAVRLVCNEMLRHAKPKARRFQILGPAIDDGLLEFDWEDCQRDRSLRGGPAHNAPMMAHRPVQDSDGKWHSRTDRQIAFEHSCCGLHLEWDWLNLCRGLEAARREGRDELDLRGVIYALTRTT